MLNLNLLEILPVILTVGWLAYGMILIEINAKKGREIRKLYIFWEFSSYFGFCVVGDWRLFTKQSWLLFGTFLSEISQNLSQIWYK